MTNVYSLLIIKRLIFFGSGMVSDENTIFSYTLGQSHSTYKDISFTPIFDLSPSEDQQQGAERICGELIMNTH